MNKHFSFGNKKLPKTTAIFNITSALECKSRKLGLCQLGKDTKKCYALKAEKCYPSVLPYRNRQTNLWDNMNAEEFVKNFMKEKGRRKIDALRFNESGDFRGQRDVNKLIKIARLLQAEGIKVYCYTARKRPKMDRKG